MNSQVVFVYLAALLLTIVAEPQQICGPNEVLDNCPANCPTDLCPTGDMANLACTKPSPCPPPACKCIFNHRRAANGTCIPTKNCSPYACRKQNEVFKPCPPLCANDHCSMAKFGGDCPPLFGQILFVLPCNPACRCKTNYWRNKGICVPANECPRVDQE